MKENVDHVGSLENLFQQPFKCTCDVLKIRFFNGTAMGRFTLFWLLKQN